MRFLVRMLPAEQDRQAFFSSFKGLAKNLGARITHPRWTSYGALEVDVFAQSAQDFELLTTVMEPLATMEVARNLDDAPPFQSKEKTIEDAIRYLNSERYWECHETLESLWRTSKGKERLLLQAIILICAGQVHEQRGETEVALGIYKRALPQISWEEESYHGIDVPNLHRQVELAIEEGAVRPLRV